MPQAPCRMKPMSGHSKSAETDATKRALATFGNRFGLFPTR